MKIKYIFLFILAVLILLLIAQKAFCATIQMGSMPLEIWQELKEETKQDLLNAIGKKYFREYQYCKTASIKYFEDEKNGVVIFGAECKEFKI